MNDRVHACVLDVFPLVSVPLLKGITYGSHLVVPLKQVFTAALTCWRGIVLRLIKHERFTDMTAQQIVVPGLGQKFVNGPMVDRIGNGLQFRVAG